MQKATGLGFEIRTMDVRKFMRSRDPRSSSLSPTLAVFGICLGIFLYYSILALVYGI